MRRIALIGVSALFLSAGTAQAFKTSTVQVHNQTNREIVVGLDDGDGRDHRSVDPGQYLVSEVLNGSCVRIHFPGKTTDAHCERTRTPVNVACDLSEDFFVCTQREGRDKDLVVNVIKLRR